MSQFKRPDNPAASAKLTTLRGNQKTITPMKEIIDFPIDKLPPGPDGVYYTCSVGIKELEFTLYPVSIFENF